ncbi:MAG TPA: hypothetical protein VFJ43_02080 [Bacteroidia bacterium]|nr:hypothetical protein [Bacteroidia bacterium]
MHQLTFIKKDGSQSKEEAIWTNVTAAQNQAKQILKTQSNVTLVQINDLAGKSEVINIQRGEK